jgi:hypothetical protein
MFLTFGDLWRMVVALLGGSAVAGTGVTGDTAPGSDPDGK